MRRVMGKLEEQLKNWENIVLLNLFFNLFTFRFTFVLQAKTTQTILLGGVSAEQSLKTHLISKVVFVFFNVNLWLFYNSMMKSCKTFKIVQLCFCCTKEAIANKTKNI